jgi:hypothetical protein
MTIYAEAIRVLEYDPQTGIVRHRINHGRAKAGAIAGTKRRDGYSVVWVDGKLHLMHRVIYLIMTGEWPAQQIDHINRDPSDNRWCNLCAVAPRENLMNRRSYRTRTDNTSGYVGVSFMRSCGKWRAEISIKSTKQYLGIFATASEAAEARFRAKHELAGGAQ